MKKKANKGKKVVKENKKKKRKEKKKEGIRECAFGEIVMLDYLSPSPMLFYSLWFLASYIHVNSFPYLGPITTLIKSSWFVHACVLCSGEVEVKQAYRSEIVHGLIWVKHLLFQTLERLRVYFVRFYHS